MTVQPTRDQLRALANAATPGPWSYADYGDPNPEHWPVGLIETDDGEEAWTCDTALAMSEPDAKFIAAARTALPRLLDQLDQAEARIGRVRDQIREPWAPSPDGDVVLVETLRNILDPDCGRGPCCLGDGHDGDCRL